MSVLNRFAERLKGMRKGARLSLEEVAGAVGVSRAAVGHYETGLNVPPMETVRKLAGLFHEDPYELAELLPAGSEAREEAALFLPDIGGVAAGPFTPVLPPAELGRRVDVRERYPVGSMLATVSGHSCTNFGLADGDTIVLRKASEPEDGRFLVAETGAGLTLKAYWHGKLWAWPKKSPVPVPVEFTEDTRVIGVVIRKMGDVFFEGPDRPPRPAVVNPKRKS